MNIDWLHDLLKDWGDYVRSAPRSHSSRSTEYKLTMGDIQLPPGPSNPEWRQRADVMEVHIAWRNLPIEHKTALWAAYAERGSPERRAEKAGYRNMAELYSQRKIASFYLLGMLNAQKDLQKIPHCLAG